MFNINLTIKPYFYVLQKMLVSILLNIPFNIFNKKFTTSINPCLNQIL